MKEVTIKLYEYSELSDDAKQRAYQNSARNFDYAWERENRDTLKRFTEIFPVNVKNWQYGDRADITWTLTEHDDNIRELSGVRLMKYIVNNYGPYLEYEETYYGKNGKKRKSRIMRVNDCPLTGYCIDDDTLQPLREFLQKPDSRTMEDILGECLWAWVYACQRDYEYAASQVAFAEDCEANEYTFRENGEMENL